ASRATALQLWWTTLRQWCFWSHNAPAMVYNTPTYISSTYGAPAMYDRAPALVLLTPAFVLFTPVVGYDTKGFGNV
ncbi:hypothetical protein AMTR_s00095p00008720, partial [Amborella trichopoda]